MAGPSYVAVEGIDGSGKTTVCAALATRLLTLDRVPILLVEPSYAPSGVSARRSVLETPGSRAAQHQLFTADRRWIASERTRPLLELARRRPAAGIVLVQDRSFFSAPAYQCAAEPIEPVIAEQSIIAPRPDAVIHLDLPVLEAVRRQGKRSPQKYDLNDIAALERAKERYIEMAVLYGFLTIDVSQQGIDTTVDTIVNTLWRTNDGE